MVGVGSIGVSISLSESSLGMPKFIHLLPGGGVQHMNVSPDHLLIVMIINGTSLKEMCTS